MDLQGSNRPHATAADELGGRVILVAAPEAVAVWERDQVDLVQVLEALRARKYLIVAVVAACVIATLVYVLLASRWYRAEVVMVPASLGHGSSFTSQLGNSSGLAGIASLAGFNLGGETDVEALAVLQSRGFARDFIEARGLLPILFASKWDAAASRWKSNNQSEWPDVRDAVEYFQKHVVRIHEDKKTGLVALSIDWKDPLQAAEWANEMVSRLNSLMRQRTLDASERNVQYLQQQLTRSQVLAVQQSVSKLLERELQSVMLAKGNEEFSYRVVDAATVPKRPQYPRPIRLIILAAVAGTIIAVLFVLASFAVRQRIRSRRPDEVHQMAGH